MNFFFGQSPIHILSLKPTPRLQFGTSTPSPQPSEEGDSFSKIITKQEQEAISAEAVSKYVAHLSTQEMMDVIFPKLDLFHSDEIGSIVEVLGLQMPALTEDEENIVYRDDEDEFEDYQPVAYPKGEEVVRREALKQVFEFKDLCGDPEILVHLFALIAADPKTVLNNDINNPHQWENYIEACKTQAQAIRLMAENIETIGASRILYMLEPLLGDEDGMLFNVFTKPPLGEEETPENKPEFPLDFIDRNFSNINLTERQAFHLTDCIVRGELIVYDAVLNALSSDQLPINKVQQMLEENFDNVPDFKTRFGMLPIDIVKNRMLALYRVIEDLQADRLIEIEEAVNDALFDLEPDTLQQLHELDKQYGDNKLPNEDNF